MRKTTFILPVLGAVLAFLLPGTPAEAQATRTWVSGVGDDANPCSRTAPCKTFAGAISKTARNGEINCIDPGGFGAVTITKSITIDCHKVFASILNSGTNGIVINFDAFQAADARKTVRLRNLNINGADTGLIGIRIIGAAASTGSEVFIQDCLIDGIFGGTARGISDERTGGGELYILNTTVRNTGQTGIAIFPASGGTKIDAVLDNVYILNANFALGVGSGARVMVFRSIFSGNISAGVAAEGPSAPSEVNIDLSVVSGNGTGLQTFAGGTIRISNTNIAFNATGIAGAGVQTFSNNRIAGNTAAGVVPTQIGGQQ